MAKKRKNINSKGRSKYDGEPFLILPHKIITSPQFRSLNGSDIKILMELCSRHYGTNNGRIAAGYEDLRKKLMMSKSTVQRSLQNLQDTGFIILRKKGKFMGRIASEWEITFLKCDGLPPSNKWGQAPALTNKRKTKIKPLEEELLEDSYDDELNLNSVT